MANALSCLPRGQWSATRRATFSTSVGEPPPPPVHLYPGYRLRQFLGRGGFGEVWEAEAESGQPVALKFLPYADSRAAIRELRSIQLVRGLSHPNLLAICDVWSSPGFLVVAMELADGSLADLGNACVAEFGEPLPAEELFPLLGQAADVLDYLNSRQHLIQGQRVGIQHCDVKPQNLLLVNEVVKLSDFGLTSPLLASEQRHRRAGTADYAAPEVFRGRLSDRTDQYAFAVSYCELRGARLPFPERPGGLRGGYTRPRPDLTMLPAPERPAVEHALAEVPQERWPSCRGFLSELERHTNAKQAAPQKEHRREARHPARPEGSCQLLTTIGAEPYPAVIRDISRGGVRLHVANEGAPLEPGQTVTLVLSNAGDRCLRILGLRISHRVVSPGRGQVIGGPFRGRLSQEELRALACT